MSPHPRSLRHGRARRHNSQHRFVNYWGEMVCVFAGGTATSWMSPHPRSLRHGRARRHDSHQRFENF
jgi:hypothetical protein